ncbi:hypothetical protein AMP9_0476 [plant metagenome]|uniref:Uncharacterized protein n=1 Tax=plant metagenome TaxID=1297885 RepID=A0A484NVW1_9ZZZZ
MTYALIASVLGLIVGIVYLYHVLDSLNTSAREVHAPEEDETAWREKPAADYRVLSSVIGSTLLIWLLSVDPLFWWLVPFSGIAAAAGVIVAFRLDRKGGAQDGA